MSGSRAYGLATDASDVDRRGVYAAPPLCSGVSPNRPPTWTARCPSSSPGSWSASASWRWPRTRPSWSACGRRWSSG
ncbi:DNA polymerase beta superfamily protein [Actinomadura madurae]|uniref:DNA polymerase beta superfamily protein n=1 Tax=Actinomadura madurae TaxID=1993 RepID=UPI0020D20FDF|nr:nucleotidyltransferase domain-containing protein [Actinomadura madurae]